LALSVAEKEPTALGAKYTGIWQIPFAAMFVHSCGPPPVFAASK
jgi:hypothetical protein